ncbi:hypothetical protein YC2023_076586 [Brassica napus]
MSGLATQLWWAELRDVWASDADFVGRGCRDVCIQRSFGGRGVTPLLLTPHLPIAGTNVIYHVKKYLRFLYVLVKKKPVNFDLLAYNQIVDTIKNSDGRQPIQFPNLIHQVLAHQRKITPLVGDNECIGKPMYLWSIPEKTYHNINQAVRMLRLLQSHVLGGEVINGEKEDDDGEDEVVQETWDERVI